MIDKGIIEAEHFLLCRSLDITHTIYYESSTVIPLQYERTDKLWYYQMFRVSKCGTYNPLM